METWLVWFVGSVFFVLSGVHIYWAAGGKRGARAAIPSVGEEPLFRPSVWGTGIVALLLAFMGLFVFQLGGYGEPIGPRWLYEYMGWSLAALFIMRAVGDFRWVGFFKRQRETLFAQWDGILFSPLCLLMGVCLIVIAIVEQ